MNTHVEFMSQKFPPYPGTVEGINAPHVYCKRLAEYLQERLPARGFRVNGIYDEDWGWYIDVENDGFPLWIGCMSLLEPSRFLCLTEPSKPVIRRWFRKIDVRDTVIRLATALDEILREDPEISDVRWWDEEEVP